MMKPRIFLAAFASLAVILATVPVHATTAEQELRQLLDWFLANAGKVEAHERFWGEELVYTSSNGTRTDRQSILDGMRATASGSDTAGDEGPAYSAADVDVRLYGDMAIVAFRLVATPAGAASAASEYFNTGTFNRRNGEWRAVAWQATRIPGADVESGD